MYGDHLHDLPGQVEPMEVYKDKDRPRRPSTSRQPGIETKSSPCVPFTRLAYYWTSTPPRLCKRVARYLLAVMAAIVYITFWYPITGPYTTPAIHSTAGAWGPHLSPLPKSRVGELRDTFSGYKHRGKSCDISSLDLHAPVGSICADKNTMLTAMSSGGRIGKDAPYLPRGCDMQWFNTREVCEILGRYSQVILVGDSMLRHVIGALNILIREDLGYGGVTDWNFNEEEKYGGNRRFSLTYDHC